ncbi:MAG: nitroreductase family protein [Deltaproteobacteria bacterium]|nr:nitroreductase family protein [Deltaproteobacteria bacterium]
MDYEGLLDLVKKRRSIRRFKSDSLPDEYLDRIIEVARWAPSGFNTQPWDFVVVKKRDLKKKIAEIILESHAAVTKKMADNPQESDARSRVEKLLHWKKPKTDALLIAPVFIILYGDKRAREGLPSGLARGPDDKFLHVFNASLANAFLYMHLAASSLGLAAQWWTNVAFEPIHSRIKQLLGIPGELVAFDMMVLGYPDAVPRPKLLRPKEKMVHFDDNGTEDYRTADEVKDFAKRTKAWTIGQHRREQFR